MILGGTVFTGWDVALTLLLYPLLAVITLVVGGVMIVRRSRTRR